MLIPAPSGACKDCACRCLRRGARYQHPAWQRSAPGRVALVLEGPISRRPAVTVAVEAPAMAAECGDRRKAHGRRVARKSRPRLQLAAVPKIAATRVPQGNPGDPSRVPEGSLGEPSSRPGRVCWGRRSTGPRVADKGARVPVATIAPAAVARAGRTARAQQPGAAGTMGNRNDPGQGALKPGQGALKRQTRFALSLALEFFAGCRATRKAWMTGVPPLTPAAPRRASGTRRR